MEKLVQRIFFFLYIPLLLPIRNASKNYVNERTRLHNGQINENAIKYIALTTVMIMSNVLLQKPAKSSKAKEDSNCGDKVT